MTPRPTLCSCGGRLKYVDDHGLVFVYCVSCTPETVMKVCWKKGCSQVVDQQIGRCPIHGPPEAWLRANIHLPKEK